MICQPANQSTIRGRNLFTVTVKTNFWASHQILLPDGSKELLHQHNWLVTAEVSSEKLDSSGLVMDFIHLKNLLEKIVNTFDNKPLEKIDYFKQNGSSAEIVAEYIYQKLEPELPKNVKLDYIEVLEHPGCSARYAPD